MKAKAIFGRKKQTKFSSTFGYQIYFFLKSSANTLRRFYIPLIILYVIRICAMLLAGNVSTKPNATSAEPAIDTFLQDKARIRGPTKRPEKLIKASRVLMINAAPVVSTPKSFNRSPKSRPNDGSIDLVHNCGRN